MSEPDNTPRSGQRDGRGRFLKGGPSPNPGGRPATPPDLAKVWDEYSVEAAMVVVELMRAGDTPETRLRAATHILDRKLGRPAQALDVTARAAPEAIAAGNPDQARARLEALIAAEEAARAPAIPAVAENEASQ